MSPRPVDRATITFLPPAGTQPAASPTAPRADAASTVASRLYEAMRGGATGWGTDEAAVLAALDGQSPAQLSAVRREYFEHYGRHLDADVASELGGAAAVRAQRLLRGDRASADAAELQRAMTGGLTGAGTDEAAIHAVLDGKSGPERAAIERAFQADHGRSLRDALSGELSGDAKVRALAQLDGDRPRADAARLHEAMKGGYTGAGTDAGTIFAVLDGKTPAERAAIQSAYGAQYGGGDAGALARDLGGELSGPDLDRAQALLANDRAGADAARVRGAMKGGYTGLGTDRSAIHDTFEGKGVDERRAVAEAYDRRYGKGAGGPGLAADLGGELSARDLSETRGIIEKGGLSDAEKLHFAMAGVGTDVEAIRGALRGKSPAEIESVRADYGVRYGGDLDADLMGELSGRDAFDVSQLLQGTAQSPEEAVKRAEARQAYERSGWVNGVSRAVLDTVAPEKGAVLDANVRRAGDIVDRATIEERPLTAAEKQQLERTLGWAEQDVSTYRAAKDSAADAAGTAAATGASLAVVVGTAGTASPALIALGAGAAGAGARVTAEAAVTGGGYGREAALADAAVGAVDGAMNVAGAPVGKAAGRAALGATSRAALAKGGAREVTGDMVELAGRDLLERSAAVRVGVGATSGAADAAVGGAAGGATAAAVREDTWADGAEQGLARVGAGAASGAGVAAGTGAVVGGALAGRGRLPDVSDDARVVKRFEEGDNRWSTVGGYDDMLAVTRALDPSPATLRVGASGHEVKVYGSPTPKELANVESALARLEATGGGKALPQEVHVRSELGAIEDASGARRADVGGLAGDGRTMVLSRDALARADEAAFVVHHEAGHNVDAALGDLSGTKGAGLFGQGDCVSAYAKGNAAEDFAETHRALIEGWDTITADPERFIDNGTDVGKKMGFILEEVYGVHPTLAMPDADDVAPVARRGSAPGATAASGPAAARPSGGGKLESTWRDLDRLQGEAGELTSKLPAAESKLAAQEAELARLRALASGATKPPYVNPGHHDPSSGQFRGGGSMTTVLPSDAEAVYARAVEEPGRGGKVWWGQNDRGDWYRFSGNGSDVHWNGSTGAAGGGRALELREVPGSVRKLASADEAVTASRSRVAELRADKVRLDNELGYAALDLDDARDTALGALTADGRAVDPSLATMTWAQLKGAAQDPSTAIGADAALLIATMKAAPR